MNVLKDVIQIVLLVILVVIIVGAVVYLTVGFGYLFGMLLAILPFISEWLTAGLPVTTQQLPGIVAWIAVAGLFIGGGSTVVKAKASEKKGGE